MEQMRPKRGEGNCFPYISSYILILSYEAAVSQAPAMFRDGILGHQFNQRLEYYASYYSQSLLLVDFKENHTLLWF
jgi:hypothetical protein